MSSSTGPVCARLAACGAIVVVVGCGGAARGAIPAASAERLATQSERVAGALERDDPCAADRLADELLAAAESTALPPDYRDPLLTAARSLAARIDCPPRASGPPVEEEKPDDKHDEDENGNGQGNGKGKGSKGNSKGDDG